jgi:hypothetical protein
MQHHLMAGIDEQTRGHLTETIRGTGNKNTRHGAFSVIQFKYARCMTRIACRRASSERQQINVRRAIDAIAWLSFHS